MTSPKKSNKSVAKEVPAAKIVSKPASKAQLAGKGKSASKAVAAKTVAKGSAAKTAASVSKKESAKQQYLKQAEKGNKPVKGNQPVKGLQKAAASIKGQETSPKGVKAPAVKAVAKAAGAGKGSSGAAASKEAARGAKPASIAARVKTTSPAASASAKAAVKPAKVLQSTRTQQLPAPGKVKTGSKASLPSISNAASKSKIVTSTKKATATPKTSEKPAAAQAPAAKATAAKAPAAKAPVAKAAVPKAPVAKAPVTAKPVAKPAVAKPAASKPAASKAAAPVKTVMRAHVGGMAQPPAPIAPPVVVAPIVAPVAVKPVAIKPAAKPHQPHGFKAQDFIVYPAHGVGQISVIEQQEVAGFKLELFVIDFAKDKMTLKVPLPKVLAGAIRKLSSAEQVAKALGTLTGRARIKRTMWSRRAQEYEAKINSGDLVTIAEVVRDLYRSDAQPEQSYSERQLYEAALDRMAREVAAVQKLTDSESLRVIESYLQRGPKRGARNEEGSDGAGDEEAANTDNGAIDEAA